jgi:hypothetical protein
VDVKVTDCPDSYTQPDGLAVKFAVGLIEQAEAFGSIIKE